MIIFFIKSNNVIIISIFFLSIYFNYKHTNTSLGSKLIKPRTEIKFMIIIIIYVYQFSNEFFILKYTTFKENWFIISQLRKLERAILSSYNDNHLKAGTNFFFE